MTQKIHKSKNHFKIILKKVYFKIKIMASYIFASKISNFIFSSKNELFLNKIVDKLLFYRKIDTKNRITFHPFDTLVLVDVTWLNNNYKLLEKIKNKNIKIVAIIYDIIPISHPQFCTENLTNSLTNWYKEATYYIDAYISISKSVRDDIFTYIKNNLNETIPFEKFSYFYLGADFSYLQIEKEIPSAFKKLFEGDDVYITVSTIEPRKNHSYVLDAFDSLWKQNKNVKYIMIGKIGWKVEDFIKRVKSHKQYNKRLFLLTNVDDASLYYAYKNSKALIFPSYIEGFGLPIVESLYCKLPVLASNIPIHKEIGKNNIAYFDLSDPTHLAKMLSNPIILKENVPVFHWQNWYESTKYLIEKCRKI